jgi:hypothetical protein
MEEFMNLFKNLALITIMHKNFLRTSIVLAVLTLGSLLGSVNGTLGMKDLDEDNTIEKSPPRKIYTEALERVWYDGRFVYRWKCDAVWVSGGREFRTGYTDVPVKIGESYGPLGKTIHYKTGKTSYSFVVESPVVYKCKRCTHEWTHHKRSEFQERFSSFNPNRNNPPPCLAPQIGDLDNEVKLIIKNARFDDWDYMSKALWGSARLLDEKNGCIFEDVPTVQGVQDKTGWCNVF